MSCLMLQVELWRRKRRIRCGSDRESRNRKCCGVILICQNEFMYIIQTNTWQNFRISCYVIECE